MIEEQLNEVTLEHIKTGLKYIKILQTGLVTNADIKTITLKLEDLMISNISNINKINLDVVIDYSQPYTETVFGINELIESGFIKALSNNSIKALILVGKNNNLESIARNISNLINKKVIIIASLIKLKNVLS